MSKKFTFRFAILDEDGNPLPCDPRTWALWFEGKPKERFIARNQVGEFWISTVFIGCSTFFETSVFDSEGENVWQEHCDTRAEALKNHAQAVQSET